MTKRDAEKVVDLYRENASEWIAARRGRFIERPWLDRFLSALPQGGRDVLDLGCGAGDPVAAYLAAAGCRITGIDAAPALVDAARERLPDHTWITADMRSLPPLPPFHGLVAWHSFFHLTPEAQRDLFGTFGALCRPDAALMFTSGAEAGGAFGSFAGRPLYHGSLGRDEYRELLHGYGFEVLHHVERDRDCGEATVWLARQVAEDM